VVKWRFDLKNFDEVAEGFQEVFKGLEDLRPFFKKFFVPAYLQTMQLQFESEGGLTGFWEGLTPEYEAWKSKHYPGRLILQRTRKLFRSFSPGGRSKYLEVQYGPRSATIRSLVEYAFWVNQTRKIMVPPGRLSKTKYKNLLEQYIGELIKRGFGRTGFSKAEKGRGGDGGFLISSGR
jgi:hypothetical protein